MWCTKLMCMHILYCNILLHKKRKCKLCSHGNKGNQILFNMNKMATWQSSVIWSGMKSGFNSFHISSLNDFNWTKLEVWFSQSMDWYFNPNWYFNQSGILTQSAMGLDFFSSHTVQNISVLSLPLLSKKGQKLPLLEQWTFWSRRAPPVVADEAKQVIVFTYFFLFFLLRLLLFTHFRESPVRENSK